MKRGVKKSSSRKKSKRFGDYFFPLSKRWDFAIVFLFLLGRFLLNFEIRTLSILFAASYLILILLMFLNRKTFVVGTVMFLFVDSIIGTFLFTLSRNLSYEYFWIILSNLIVIFFLVFDMKGNFKR